MAGITYLHTGGDLNRRSGGGHTFKLCTIFSHTLELLLAFPYDWENETILPDALRHFKRYQTCMVTFCTYYIAWILGDEGRGENGDCSRSVVRTVSTGCETPQCAASWMLLLYARDSSRWLLTPSLQFLSRGAQTFWHRARAYSGNIRFWQRATGSNDMQYQPQLITTDLIGFVLLLSQSSSLMIRLWICKLWWWGCDEGDC